MSTLRALVVAVSMLAGCYRPELASCRYLCVTSKDCPSDLVCNAGKCANDDDRCGNIEMPDAADVPPARDFYNVAWGTPIALTATADGDACERHPVLSPDGSTLLVARSTGTLTANPQTCLDTAKIVQFSWTNENASAVSVGALAGIDSATIVIPGFIVDGAELGTPSERVLVFAAGASAQNLVVQRLSFHPDFTPTGDPATSIIAFAEPALPSFDRTATLAAVTLNQDVWVGPGSLAQGYKLERRAEIASPGLDFSPALSPDGRVIVWVRGPNNSETNLMVARRRSIDLPFEAPILLPLGNGEINSYDYEYDPFITANGDLFFASTRDDHVRRRIFFAPSLLDP